MAKPVNIAPWESLRTPPALIAPETAKQLPSVLILQQPAGGLI